MADKQHQQLSSTIIIIAAVVAVAAVITVLFWKPSADKDINTFQACKSAGGALLETYPEQCMINGKSFTDSAQTPNNGSSNDYVGLAEQAALDKAKSANTPARVVERDGESLPVTMDYVPGRLNLYVKDGKVYKVQIEGSETN